MTTVRQFYARHAIGRDIIERFLDRNAHNWGRYDAELGYLHGDYCMRDGIDGSYTINRMGADGARLSPSADGRPCRINTYGDSFTHCDQVSDGETWQEYLAAHLGEPVRNFGTGGHGVYQAWRRLQREEATANAAEHVILNLFEDDHRRSVMSCRWFGLWEGYYAMCRRAVESGGAEVAYFHNNPWDHLEWDFARETFVECKAVLRSPSELTKLCDLEWMRETFAGDFHVQAVMAMQGVDGVDLALLRRYAEAFAVPFDTSGAEALAGSAWRLLSAVGLRSTLWVLERLRAFAEERRKRVLVLMSYGPGGIVSALKDQPREDSVVIERARALGFPVVDIRDHHLADFRDFSCDPETYAKRYFNGHYSPRGNHFFAYAIKDEVVRWLAPKPLAYRDQARDAVARLAATLNGGAARAGD